MKFRIRARHLLVVNAIDSAEDCGYCELLLEVVV
jgi:hypothetical protein